MTIRTTGLGGTDWDESHPYEHLKPSDLNDTINALVNRVGALTMFWMNSDLSTVYDNFDSYSVGAFTTNSLWTVNLVSYNIATASIASSTNAGGSTKELVLVAKGEDGGLARNSTATISTIGLSDNTHKYLRLAYVISAANNGCNIQFKFGSQSYTMIMASQGISIQYTDIKVIALGSSSYDVYLGGKKIYSNVNEADPQLYILATGNGAGSSVSQITVYIDDVIESSGSA